MITEPIAGIIAEGMPVSNVLLEELKQKISGNVITSSHDQYNAARAVWNGMIDRKPAVIVQCKNTEDVVHAIKFAHEHAMKVSVKGGGHNIAGNAVCDAGVMIDFPL